MKALLQRRVERLMAQRHCPNCGRHKTGSFHQDEADVLVVCGAQDLHKPDPHKPDLHKPDLHKPDRLKADPHKANLQKAGLHKAGLHKADRHKKPDWHKPDDMAALRFSCGATIAIDVSGDMVGRVACILSLRRAIDDLELQAEAVDRESAA